MAQSSGMLGGYIRGMSNTSGMLGGWVAGIETPALDATFYAFFNVIGRTKEEFDAAVKIIKTLNSDFDAKVITYVSETPPIVSIIVPNTHQSGVTIPISYNFEATVSGYNNKRIIFTQWFFSDIPIVSGSVRSSSGTYQTAHTFNKSGLFDVIFIAVDEAGLVSSDRRMINTASGVTLPQIRLTASTLSGLAPLTVGFSGIIDSAPNPIIDKFIYFGDGTYSPSTQNINKLYFIPGTYIPVFRIIDKEGYIVTDSIIIGANN